MNTNSKYRHALNKTYFKRLGKVVNVVGLTVESVGPDAKLNDMCRIIVDPLSGKYIYAEVVGFRNNRTLLMPYDVTEGIGYGCLVENTGEPLSVNVGEGMLGLTLDGLGRMSDGTYFNAPRKYPLDGEHTEKAISNKRWQSA